MADKIDPKQIDSIVESIPSRGITLRLKSFINRMLSKDYDFSNLDTNRFYYENNLKKANRDLDSIPHKRRAAILSNIIYESNFDPTTIADNGLANGYMSWHPDRFHFHSKESMTPEYQLKYTVGTLSDPSTGVNWTHGGKGTGYKTGKEAQEIFYNPNSSLEDITRAISMGYARPREKEEQYKLRLKTARDILKRIQNIEGE